MEGTWRGGEIPVTVPVELARLVVTTLADSGQVCVIVNTSIKTGWARWKWKSERIEDEVTDNLGL